MARFARHQKNFIGFAGGMFGGRWVWAWLAPALMLGAWAAGSARAQCPPVWFNTPALPRLDGTVRTVVTSPSGATLIGGEFLHFGDITVNGVVLLAADSASAQALGSGVDGRVNAAIALSTGDFVIAGDFAHAGGVPVGNIARYSPATGLWTTLGSGTNGEVLALAVLSDGSLVAGGQFAAAGGVAVNNIARYSFTTGAWSALAGGVSGGPNPSVRALLQPPGTENLFVGGSFEQAGGIAAPNLARYVPSVDAWASIASGTNGPVNALASKDSGVLIGGAFTSAGGIAGTNHLALCTIGGVGLRALGTGVEYEITAFGGDSASYIGTVGPSGGASAFHFTPDFSPPYISGVVAIANGPDGPVRAIGPASSFGPIFGGEFQSTGGDPSLAHVARLAITQPDAWNPIISSGLSGAGVRAIVRLDSARAIIAGDLDRYSSTALHSIAAYGLRGSVPSIGFPQLSSGTDGPVNALLATSPDLLVAAGDFSAISGQPASFIAEYSFESQSWAALGSGVDAEVLGVLAAPNSDIIALGRFTHAGNTPASHIAGFSRSTHTWYPLGAGLDADALCGVALPSGDIVAGGRFVGAGGATANHIARFSPGTGAWAPLGAGLNGDVLALVLLPDGDLIAGGAFTLSGSTPLSHVARYSFASQLWSPLGAGAGDDVYALALLTNGDLVAGGRFTDPDGRSGVARYSFVTNDWTPVVGGVTGVVKALLTLENGELLAGGFSIGADGTPQATLSRLFTGVPLIVTQPAPVDGCPGHNFQLQVLVGNCSTNDCAFQWRKDGAEVDPAFYDGSNTPTLSIVNLTSGFAGTYDCVVTSACGTAISDAATVRLLDPDSPGCLAIACDPDYNQDGNADQADIEYLINTIGGENSPPLDPDFNHDGNLDQGDIDALINTIAGGGCP